MCEIKALQWWQSGNSTKREESNKQQVCKWAIQSRCVEEIKMIPNNLENQSNEAWKC